MKQLKRIVAIAVLMAVGIQNAGAYSADMIVGPQTKADGSMATERSDKTGAQVIQDAHGRYTEAAVRGKIFSLTNAAYTVVAANVSGGALGTVLFINGFYNPIGSGVNAVMLFHKNQTTSGTPGGPLVYNYYCGLNITSAATGSIKNGILSNTAANSAMIPQVAIIVAATPAATPAALVYGPAGGAAAVAAGAGLYSYIDEVAGSIVVPPGCVIGVAATAAGTTQVVTDQLVWEEVAQ